MTTYSVAVYILIDAVVLIIDEMTLLLCGSGRSQIADGIFVCMC